MASLRLSTGLWMHAIVGGDNKLCFLNFYVEIDVLNLQEEDALQISTKSRNWLINEYLGKVTKEPKLVTIMTC